MGNRTPFTQRVDEDLQEFVDSVATQTNLSKADVIDEALRRLRDTSTITDDGQFIVDGDFAASDAKDGDNALNEVLENQQEMLELLRDSPTPRSEPSAESGAKENSQPTAADGGGGSEVLATTETSEVEEQIAALSGDYNHDECIDPDDVAEIDTRESDVVAHSRRHLIPAVTGMINHLAEEQHVDRVEWDEVEELITGTLGMSSRTASNYRGALIEHGVIIPHPSIDDRFVGEDMVEASRTTAANTVQKRAVTTEGDIEHPSRYPDEVSEFVDPYCRDWHYDVYLLTGEAYFEEVWSQLKWVAEKFASLEPSNGRSRKGAMSQKERVAGACRVFVHIAKQMGEYVEIDGFGERMAELLVEARKAEGDELYDWKKEWAEFVVRIREHIGDTDSEESLGEEEAREVLGVNEGATDEEILEAYEEYVMDNHPDADGSDEEIDTDEFHRVLEAKRTLTA